MKVYLDDLRPEPPGWRRVHWPDQAIRLLEAGRVAEISLDHDLGNYNRGTGYDVLVWIEEAVAERGFRPPKIKIHTANPAARLRMIAAVRSIRRLARAQTRSKRAD